MADAPRKTLALPKKAASEAATLRTRKPLRGGAPDARRKASTAPAVPTAAQEPAPSVPRTHAPRAQVAHAKIAKAAAATPSPARPVKPQPRPARPEAKARVPALPRAPALPPTASSAAASGVRVSKLMAERGLCSRREADSYIERGWVFVDGERVTELGTRADPASVITLDRSAKAAQQRLMTILLNKPVGYVSGQPEPGFTPAVTLIQPENQQPGSTPRFHPAHLKGLAPAGRLDIDSTGLLVLTQDGRIARKLIGDDSSVAKEYIVRVEGQLNAKGLALLNHGLNLDGRELRPAKVEWINDEQLRFVLTEGRKRQIRRMCELVGLRVVALKRVRIGRVVLGDLPVGQWRYLRDDEAF
jgi:23S rRNA pseudouridine2604 synthase